MKAIFTFGLAMFLLLYASLESKICFAEEYNGEMRFIFKNLPSFYDYPNYEGYTIPQPPKSIAEEIDWDSHPGAWTFRTRLREGFKMGPDYAGKYVVVGIGCGTACSVFWIINVESGKVIGSVGGFSASYKIDSRLLIINLPSDVMKVGDEYGFSATEHPIDFYLIGDDETFKLIKRMDVSGMFPDVDTIQANQ